MRKSKNYSSEERQSAAIGVLRLMSKRAWSEIQPTVGWQIQPYGCSPRRTEKWG